MIDTNDDAAPGHETTAQDPQRRNLGLALLTALGGMSLLEACASPGTPSEGTGSVQEGATGTNFIWLTAIGTAAAPLDLRNLSTTGLVNDQIVGVTGYYAHGDGGGGFFYWDSASNATDNGGTVVNPAGHVGAGRWIRIVADFITAYMFGAKGDGSTDDRNALQAAADFLSAYQNSFDPVLGYDLKSTTLYLGRGRFKIGSSLTTMIGMRGDGASIVAGPTIDVFSISNASGQYEFIGVNFFEFKHVYFCWGALNTSLTGSVSFTNCRFTWGRGSIVCQGLTPNFWASFDGCYGDWCNLAKGCFAGLTVVGYRGTSMLSNDWTSGTVGTAGQWTGAWIELGGTENGIALSNDTGAIVACEGVSLSPGIDGVNGASATQSWFLFSAAASQLNLNGCRFGGESGGMALIIAETGVDGFDVSGQAVICPSSRQPWAILRGAPEVWSFDDACILGDFGGAGLAMSMTQSVFDKISQRSTNYLQVGRGYAGNVNETLVNNPRFTIGSTALHTLEFLFRAGEERSYPQTNEDTSYTVYDTVSSTNAVVSDQTLNCLPSKRFVCVNAGAVATGQLIKWFPDSLAAGWYTAILFYKTNKLDLATGATFAAYSTGGASPRGWPLTETNGNISSASVTFYHDGSAATHTHVADIRFKLQANAAAYFELVACSLVKGYQPSAYLRGNLPVIQLGNQVYLGGSTAPASGTWRVGDRVLNMTNPGTAGNYGSFVCRTAGTPGVWQGLEYTPLSANVITATLGVLAPGVAYNQVFSVPGASVGDAVDVTTQFDLGAGFFYFGIVPSAGNVRVSIVNLTSAPSTSFGALSLYLYVRKQLHP